MTTLSDLNAGNQADFIAQLHGIYEQSPWIAQRAVAGILPKTAAQACS